MSDYDAIVIGAGNAGLTAAATLQRGGVRTLLLERHNIPGGCATSFRRGRFEFEVALHQLSGVGVEGQPISLREGLFAQLGIADKLEFVQEHDLYRAVIPGRLDVTLPADWEAAAVALDEQAPGNKDRVSRFFELVKQVTFWQVAAMRGMPVEQIDPALFRYGLRPLKDVLDEYFDDDRIKLALGTYWSYLGQPPSKLRFQDLALTLFAYFEFKPWHVRGGSQAMSTAVLDTFLEAGGEVRFNTGVEAILTTGGRAFGVRLDDGTEVTAPDVVSNASLPTTYGMLDGIMCPPRCEPTCPPGASACPASCCTWAWMPPRPSSDSLPAPPSSTAIPTTTAPIGRGNPSSQRAASVSAPTISRPSGSPRPEPPTSA
ncbi:FAD-dependent oxidoreductase [Nocardia asteroides]